jgi:hypothetical protein
MRDYTDDTALGTLHQVTLTLLKSSGEATFDIAEATGLTYGWIAAFAANRMRNPSVSRVQRLYEHLIGKPLKLAR